MVRVWVLLLTLLLSRDAFSSSWSDDLQLAGGKLLVATPQLKDATFRRTVVLLIDHSPQGARGVILNRALGTTLAGEFSDLLRPEQALDPLYFGGPVGGQHRVILTDLQGPGFPVLEGVRFVHGRHLLDGVRLLGESEAVFRIFAGFSGWSPLQLEHEVARGDWIVLPATAYFVLHLAPQRLWPELIRYRDGRMAGRTGAAEAQL